MSRLLVSVRSAAEARCALVGGADVIDVKEPSRGSLGAADTGVWREVRRAVDGKLPLSAALGELLDADWSRVERTTITTSLRGYHYAKLGLAGCAKSNDWRARWRETLAVLPAEVAPVAVAYADWRSCGAPSPRQVLQVGAALGCAGLLLDTFDKQAGDLFNWLSIKQLTLLVETARQAKCFLALAGSLSLQAIPRALETGADVIAVRGAVCNGARAGDVAETLVRNLAQCVKRTTARSD